MTTTLLVTGATGLTGAVLCEMAVNKGYRVRALVRSRADALPLQTLGAELVDGDVTNIESLLEAFKGADGVIHAAAVIGGTWSKHEPEEFWAVNYHGVVNVLDAAEQCEVPKTVLLNTTSIMDFSVTMTETSPIAVISEIDSPYAQAKRTAFYESMRRACLGHDIRIIHPGGIYGPSPLAERALMPTSFNAMLLLGLRNELERYVDMPMPWVYVDDVAAVSLGAFEKGVRGGRYLAAGRAEDVCSTAEFCNRVNALAGVTTRVKDVPLAEVANEIGAMKHLATRTFADPLIDPTGTTKALGVEPTPISTGVKKTVEWFRELGKI